MEFKDQLKTTINLLADRFTADNNLEHAEILELLKASYAENPRSFLKALDIGQVNFEMLVSEVFNLADQRNKYLLKYIVNGLFEHFHKTRIIKVEGMSCSTDKSSYVKRMTLKALQTGENLSLFDDYLNVEQIKENKEEQAYWSPTSIQDTDEAIKLFWDWYRLVDYK